MADVRPIAIDDADSIIRSFHLNVCNIDPVQAVPNGEAAPIVNGAWFVWWWLPAYEGRELDYSSAEPDDPLDL